MTFTRYRHALALTAWKILQRKLRGRRVPLITNLTLTYRCDLRCQYCGIWKQPAPEMTCDQISHLIEEIAHAGGERLSLGGGEPMLRDDIGVFIRKAKSCGLTVNLLSNGYQIADRIAELRGLDYLSVSLDGPQAVHDRLRGSGAFAQAISAIRAARAAGIEVWVTAVITRHNHDALGDLLEIVRAEGVRISVQPVMQESLWARRAENLAPTREAFLRVIDLLTLERGKADSPVAMSRSLLRFYRDYWGTPKRSNTSGAWQGGRLACQAGQLFCSVGPDGRLHSCNYRYDGAALSCIDLGFAEAFRQLQAPDCQGCWCDSFIESNLVFAFDPLAMLGVAQLLAKPLRQKATASDNGANNASTAK